MDEPQNPERPDVDSSRDPLEAPAASASVREEPFGSGTFCILPWIHTFIDVNGDVKLCCIATGGLTANRQSPSLSLQQDSLRNIWNSPEMKEVRRKMLSGEKVVACSRCNKEDALGQVSLRVRYNEYWLQGHPERDKWRERVADSIARGYEVPMLPVYIDIRPGNLCTLKCRMCHADYSNLIADDPVHSLWAYKSSRPAPTRFSDGKHWYEAEDVVIDELLENIEDTRMFYLAGGEPLVNPFVRKLIDTLIERGAAGRICIEISTNVTVAPKPLLEKLTKFAFVRLFLSLDGTGPLYEYIRYPGKWDRVLKNVEEVSRFANFQCSVTTTVQNYNVLSVTDIFTVTEALGLPCNFNLVYSPQYLSIRTMPRKARDVAAERLRELKARVEATPGALPGVVANIASVITELEQESEHLYRKSIRDFMRFTSGLDRSRGQQFSEVCPELYQHIIDDGNVWDDGLQP